MGTTTTRQLPYPELADPPNVPSDIKKLADKVDSSLDETVKVVADSASRPPHKQGRIVYQTNDLNAIYVSNGTKWTRYVSSNGQRIQSGWGVYTTDSGGGVNITFPVPFDTAPVITAIDGDSGGGNPLVLGLWSPGWTAASFNINCRRVSTNSVVANGLVRIHWIAVGTVAP